jgi:hypothetical protein
VLDRAEATRVAAEAGLNHKSDDPLTLELTRTLERFPKADEVIRHVASLGFTKAADQAESRHGVVDEEEYSPLTPAEVLEHDGRLYWFDVETGEFPNEHDGLLFELADLAKPALDGVLFEEQAPPEDEGNYVLRAYMDGRTYELDAQNHGDWYDLEAVIGLLNSLTEARRSNVRFIVAATGDQTARVIAGPASGLSSLVADRLVLLDAPDASMKDGQAFENQVIDGLLDAGVLAEAGVPKPARP